VAGWLCRESCCAEKAAAQGKLLFRISVFGSLAGCLAMTDELSEIPTTRRTLLFFVTI
jgi:hypothetical protein